MADKPKDSKNSGDAVKVYETPELTWVNITSPSREALAQVKERYPFLMDIDLRDCLPPYQRPKLMNRGQYLFMVLLFPIYDDASGSIKVSELDMFVGKDFIITNHFNELAPLQQMADCYEGIESACPAESLSHPAHWVHTLLSQLLMGCFPMLTHIANDIDRLERSVSGEKDYRTVRDIIRIKSNIVDFRRTMQGHKRVYQKFIAFAPAIIKFDGLDVHYEDLVGHTKEIWDFLENDSNTIEAVYQSYTALINFETSEASKALAALALIIFPTTLVAAIFAMDAEHMPIRGYLGDWWIMLAIVLTTAAVVIYFLRKKRWL